MTSKEFVLWLQGFTQGVHEYSISPKQWDALKVKLAEVNDEPIGIKIGEGGLGVPNTQSFSRWQEPSIYYPNVEIPCVKPNGTATPHFVTPSIDGFAVAATPGYGSITYNPSTSTTYGYPSGSAWNYTSTQKEPIPPTSEKELLTENHD